MVLGWTATAAIVVAVSITFWSTQTGFGRLCLVLGSLSVTAVLALTVGYMRRPADSRESQQHAYAHL